MTGPDPIELAREVVAYYDANGNQFDLNEEPLARALLVRDRQLHELREAVEALFDAENGHDGRPVYKRNADTQAALNRLAALAASDPDNENEGDAA